MITFEKVNCVPNKKNEKHDLQKFIEDFVNSDCEVAKVKFTKKDYKSSVVCAACLKTAVKRSKYLNVKVFQREENVYISK